MKQLLFLMTLTLSTNSFAVKNSIQGQAISSDLFNSSTLSIGSIQQSILSLSQFQSINGNCWRLMDGSSLSGTELGSLLGESQPNLPNALSDSGYFLRQASGGRNLGSIEADAFQGHGHRLYAGNTNHSYNNAMGYGGANLTPYAGGSDSYAPQGATVNTGSGVPRTATETRPKNIAINMFIKVNKLCVL